MKIVVGLGNPGRQYRGTPHNVGFEVVELLARRWSGRFAASRREKAELCEVRIGPHPVLLARPLTFMNLSGEAVRELIRQKPVELSDLLIVSDDVNLEIGRLRLRERGSDGGQKGLRSIIRCLGSQEFPRLRIGIRPQDRPIDDLTDFVLSRLRPEERRSLETMIETAADAAECWIREGPGETATRFNRRLQDEEKTS